MSGLLQHLKTVDSMLGSCAGIKPGLGEKYAVLWHEKAEALARELLDLDHSRFEPFDVKWEHWNDGTDHIVITKMNTEKKTDGVLSNRHVLFVASFHDNSDTLSQLHLLHYVCLQLRPASVTVVLPFIPTGTMERIAPGKEGDVPTAFTLASMFNGLPFNPGVRIMTYEIHALQIAFYFQVKSGITPHSAIPMLINHTRNAGIDCVVFPDDGANKRFSGYFPLEKFHVVTCAKQHASDEKSTKKTLRIELGNPEGRNVIIVDDMTRSGSTMFECMKAVIEKGAKSVSMFVTHAAFTDEFWMNLYTQSFGRNSDNFKSKFKKFYTTNSVHSANMEFVEYRCRNSRIIYMDKLRRMKMPKESPFVKLKEDFSQFDVLNITGDHYDLLLERWFTRLPAVDDENSLAEKFEILSLAETIVKDL